MTTITKECPKCGTSVEFETDTITKQIIDDGIEEGIKNKSEHISKEKIENAVKPILKTQATAHRKELEDLKNFFKEQLEDERNKKKEEMKLMADQHRKDMERMQKGGSMIADIGKQKSYDEGRLQEEDIETLLKNTYNQLGDSIQPVPDGEKGADVIHNVFFEGNEVGKIVVESKKTKNYQKIYETKLLNDMKNANGDYGVLVTKAMPVKGGKKFVIEQFNGKMLIIKKDLSYEFFLFAHKELRQKLIDRYKNKSNFSSSKDIHKHTAELVNKLNGPEITNIFIKYNLSFKKLIETLRDDYKNREKTFNKLNDLIIDLKSNLKEQVEIFQSSPAITSEELKKIEIDKLNLK